MATTNPFAPKPKGKVVKKAKRKVHKTIGPFTGPQRPGALSDRIRY